ncbi:MAG: glycosyltransferase [Actinobacteria bacterium]|nr:MAG: glycosyltransferase [Actinomycetota bacterium]
MRVCIVTTVHPPTDGRIFHRQAVTLASQGHEVFLLHQKGEGEETRDGVSFIGSEPPPNRAARAMGARELVKRALALGPDVVHAHDPELLQPSAKLCRRARVAFVYDVHEDYVGMIDHKEWIPGPLKPLAKVWVSRQERRYVRRADGVVVADRQLAEIFSKLNPNTVVAHNFPPAALFPRPEAGAREEIVYEGSISPVRGAFIMVELVKRLRERYPRLKLVMIGTIHAKEEQIRRIASEAGEGAVEFEEPVPYERLHERLAGARLGLCLLKRNRKFLINVPTKIFDYMACGVPYLASDFPNIRGLVGDVGGRLVDPKKIDEIEKIAAELLKEPETGVALGGRGRWAFEQKYNWDVESRGLIALYEKIAKKRGKDLVEGNDPVEGKD